MAEHELQQERARATQARERLPSVVALLVERFAVRRVVLFGSPLEGRLHEHSDIDLAVEGLAPERYWEALWRAEAAAGRHVDLVPTEDASDAVRERLATVGEVLYG